MVIFFCSSNKNEYSTLVLQGVYLPARAVAESVVSHPAILSGQMLLSADYIVTSVTSMRVIPLLDFSRHEVSSLVRNVTVN